MPGAIVSAKGGFPAAASASTYNLAITSTTANSFLFVVCRFNTAGATRTISSNGTGTWSLVYDSSSFDGNNIAYWICKDPGAGTTQITADNGGTLTFFTLCVLEISGLLPGGTTWSPANHNNQTTVTAWTSSSISPTGSVFAVGISSQASGATPLSSGAGGSWSDVSGTGFTTGNNSNTAEGDDTYIEIGSFGSGSLSATGTWASAVSPFSFIVAFDEITAGNLAWITA
jgi:hypothetical protein